MYRGGAGRRVCGYVGYVCVCVWGGGGIGVVSYRRRNGRVCVRSQGVLGRGGGGSETPEDFAK